MNKEMDHEWNLDEYERLITETFKTFTNYGDVNQYVQEHEHHQL